MLVYVQENCVDNLYPWFNIPKQCLAQSRAGGYEQRRCKRAWVGKSGTTVLYGVSGVFTRAVLLSTGMEYSDDSLGLLRGQHRKW